MIILCFSENNREEYIEKISSAGLVYLCLAGRLVEDQIKIQKVDTYKETFGFYEEANAMLETEVDVIVFAVVGICDKVEKIASAICQQINENFNRILEDDRLEMMIPQMDFLGNEFNQLIQANIFENDDIKFPQTYTTEGDNWKIECFWTENICDAVPAEPIIEKNFCHKVMLKQIKELQKYLRGEETEVISKDLWLTLNSRYISSIFDIFERFFGIYGKNPG